MSETTSPFYSLMTASVHSEIVICGGSLAGLSAAIRLKQLGFSPLVLEKSLFPRKKLCGEFLGPDAFIYLQTLGVWDEVRKTALGPVSEACFHGMRPGQRLTIDFAWFNPDFPFGLGITRERLDWLMLSHARSMGVEVWEECKVLSVLWQPGNNAFIVQLQHKGSETLRPTEIQTPVFVDASGRHGGIVATVENRALAIRRKKPQLTQKVGVKVNVSLPGLVEKRLHMVFFPGGYGGIQPLSDHTANVCFLADPQLAGLIHEPFEQFIEQTIGLNPYAREYLQGAEPIEAFQTTANINLNGSFQVGYPLLRIGDARITVDPVTGSGMTLALETGILCAERLANGLRQGKTYAHINQHFERDFQRYLGKRLALLRMLRPFLYFDILRQLSWPLFQLFARPLTLLLR